MFASKVRLDPRPFVATLNKMLKGSRRGAEVVCTEQARGVLRRIIAMTPPGKRNTQGAQAGTKGGTGRGTLTKADQRRGEKTVARDILKIMQPVAPKKAERTDIAAVHKSMRKAGRVRGAKAVKVKVPRAGLKAYIKRKMAEVGRLAKGWVGAAKKLAVAVPDWVANHAGESGDGKITITPTRVRILMRNKVGYASNVGALYKRVRTALEGQRKAMERRMKSKVAEAAKRAGLKATP